MTRTAQLLASYAWRSCLGFFAWRGFLFTLVVNQAVTPLLGLAVWTVALPGNDQVSTYYVALLVVQLFTVSYEHHTFSNHVYDGGISHDLLKPHSVIIAALGDNIAMRVLHVVMGLPFILVAAVLVGVTFEARWMLAALPAVLLAALLRFVFTFLLALSAFWTQQAHGVVGFGETMIFLLGGSAAPIQFFPPALRPWGEALPFRAMLGFPAEIATGSLGSAQILQGYAWQCGWIVVFGLMAILVWRAAVRRYTAVGG
jgi:ABC-2 type transport system permease protein